MKITQPSQPTAPRGQRNPPSRRRQQAGYALVLVVLLLFGLMGLAALVIDVGFARLAQRQMQTAVDAAALEGLRFRDEIPEHIAEMIEDAGGDAPPEGDRSDPAWREYARRWLASRMVNETFEDYIDPNTGEQIRYGAGPEIEFEGGFGPEELAAGQTVKLDRLGVWTPSLQLNSRNHHYGDVVAGKYDYDPLQEGVPAELPGRETQDYQVTGFEPKPEGTPPQELADAPALLVRLRRTNNFSGWDEEHGVSSHGPTLPFMFARGALIGKVPDAQYSPRENGITVRALAIAEARPAVAVGVARSRALGDQFDLLGAELLAVRTSVWNSLPRDDGDPSSDQSEVVSVDGVDVGSVAVALRYIGERVTLTDQPISAKGYLPIFHEVNGVDRVVGFGFADVVLESPTEVRLKKLVTESSLGAIAPENASARLSDAWEVLQTLTEAELDTVLDLNWNSANPTPTAPSSFVHPLLSPVSVR